MRLVLALMTITTGGCTIGQGVADSVHPSWGPAVVVDESAVPRIAESHFGPRIASATDCASVNGSWGAIGENSEPRCVVPTTDGGTSCTDHAQCQGLCLADWNVGIREITAGQCAGTYYDIGCHSWVYSGRVGRRVCLD